MLSVTTPEIRRLVGGRSVDVLEGDAGVRWCWHPTTAIVSASDSNSAACGRLLHPLGEADLPSGLIVTFISLANIPGNEQRGAKSLIELKVPLPSMAAISETGSVRVPARGPLMGANAPTKAVALTGRDQEINFLERAWERHPSPRLLLGLLLGSE